MRVVIDAPQRRSLSANEKRVYQLLCQGLTSFEVARKLHMRHGTLHEYMMNNHDTPIETVVNLITSIREKGWEIPEPNKNNEEESEEMARVNLTEEDRREIVQLRESGMNVTDVAEKFGIKKQSVHNIVSRYKQHGEMSFTEDIKEEPETAATDSDSEQNVVPTNSADIIPHSEDIVKLHVFTSYAADAIWDKVVELRQEYDGLIFRGNQIEQERATLNEKLRAIDEQMQFIESQIDALVEDYEAVI